MLKGGGKYVRHFVAVLVGAIMAWLVQLATSNGVEVDPDQVSTVSDALVNGLSLLASAVLVWIYSWVEKFLKRFKWLDLEGYAEREEAKRKAAFIDSRAPYASGVRRD